MSGDEGTTGGKPRAMPLHRSPKQLALVIVVFVVILGVPVGLFVYVGRWMWALGFLAAWTVMVLVTGLFLWKAAGAVREDG